MNGVRQSSSDGTLPFRVGPWQVEPDLSRLIAGEEERHLNGKAMTVLLCLVDRPGRLVTKDELVDSVWQGRAVSDDALFVCIYELRKALGDRARSPRFIETVHGKGYRWLAEVEWLDEASLAPELHGREPEPGGSSPDKGEIRSDELSTRSSPPMADPPTADPPMAAPRPRLWPMPKSGPTAPWVFLALILLVGSALAATRWQGSKAQPSRYETLAVLPLADLTPGQQADDRAFADGMTEALVHALARTGPLQVVSRISTRRFVDRTELSAPEIARQLQADLLLEGSITRAGDAVRISIQLIDGTTDRHLWTDRYEVDLGELFDLQSRVARAVASEVGRQAGALARLPPRLAERWDGSLEPEAVEAYLQGRYELFQGTYGSGSQSDLERALEVFDRAVELEPGYAEAHVGLAETRLSRLWGNLGDEAENRREARRAAARAIDLDPGLAAAHTAQGRVRMIIEHDLDAAEQSFRRALELAPGDSEVYSAYAWMLQTRRRFDEAEAMARRSLRLDPLSPVSLRLLVNILYDRDQPAAALEYIDRIDRLSPGAGDMLRSASLMNLERFDEARPVWRRLLARRGVDSEVLDQLDAAYDKGGHSALLREFQQFSMADSLSHGVLLMRLGEPEAALRSLEVAAGRDDPQLLIVYASPIFVPLHQESRFRKILRQYDLLP
ncbi:MAG: winged helix-turn-helix domain-containing protein [Acidobacteriota bacterium]